MEKIFYTPEKFTTRGEKFETPSRIAGTCTIEFLERTDSDFIFLCGATSAGSPKAILAFSEDELATQVFRLVPGRIDRLVINDTARQYEKLLLDPYIDRIVRY